MNRWQVVLLATWALTMTAGLFLTAQARMVEFDPEGRLSQGASSLDFDSEFEQWIAQQRIPSKEVVVHFIKSDCGCNITSQSHRNSVNALASEQSYQNINVTWTNDMAHLVPSAPAVAVINGTGELKYLGPYSSGIFCSAGNGLVEPFIANKPVQPLGAVVISDAQGCYCT